MMGGLAYMTGPPGQPLRAGASVNDIMGGLFGVIAILAALCERDRTGRGGLVQSGLFETNMVLVAQHMARAAIEGREPPPFGDPTMRKPWPLYDVFDTADEGAQVFVGVVTETQWRGFCQAFGLDDLLADPALAGGMRQLAAGRPCILPRVAAVFRTLPKAELMARCEALGLPFAPIARPGELFDDPHLRASGGLLPVDLAGAEAAPGGAPARPEGGLPALPLSLPAGRPGLRRQPPRAGEHGAEIAREAGLSEAEVAALVADGTLAASGGIAPGVAPPTPERAAAAVAAAE
jgi:crotonobetainyl-CoA:carnitine CoA-transferase CaiB-like acyl-CoA transferase